MSDTSQEEASHCDMDHGFGDFVALFAVTHHAQPSHHPSESSLDEPLYIVANRKRPVTQPLDFPGVG